LCVCLVCEVLPSPYVVPGVGGWVGLIGNIDCWSPLVLVFPCTWILAWL
jgi:hypothetical protein